MTSTTLSELGAELKSLRADMLEAEERFLPRYLQIPENRRASASNLLHYLALRKRDLRSLQHLLSSMGLSSLGRAESHALQNLLAVMDVIGRLGGERDDYAGVPAPAPEGRLRLVEQTRALLGPSPSGRDVHIMVTMPGEAARDRNLIHELLASGMNCMRINAAHDDVNVWEQMLGHLRDARDETGLPCKVLVDVAGPKLRTGPIAGGPPVVRWRPSRDELGRVIKSARIWLVSSDADHHGSPPAHADVVLPVGGAWLRSLRAGDTLKLFDARGSVRTCRIVGCTESGVWAESDQTAYVLPGTIVQRIAGASADSEEQPSNTVVGPLAPTPRTVKLSRGDTLVLSREAVAGCPAVMSDAGATLSPAVIPVTLPEIFDGVRVGEAVWLDDGKIGGLVEAISPGRIQVHITHARPGGSRLAADKGINLPDTRLRLPALTAKDAEDLRFIARHADLVGYSFVRTEQDVFDLQSHLQNIGGAHLGLILKIETRQAFEELPALLLAAMRSPSSGVMIARGDLAVECGYERLAEVQEEIMWLAEASHTPVIWATQVLETLAKDGIPSRAEITDAAMGERAECVMLNKGPFILEAVRALDNILKRMQAHQYKKSAMLRQLGLASRFLTAGMQTAEMAGHA